MGGTVSTKSYDNAGQLTGQTTTKTITTDYDASDNPATITTVAGSSTTIEGRTYDGNSLVTRYTVDEGSGTNEYDAVWDATSTVPQILMSKFNGFFNVRSDRVNGLLAYQVGSDPAWYKRDAHGSAINPDANTNAATAPTGYSAFGAPTGNLYMDVGYRAETHTGATINLRNRDYDPTTAQFTSQDPLDGIDGTPTVANPYHYTDNDPYNRTDPLGLRAKDSETLNGPDLAALRRRSEDLASQAANGELDRGYSTGLCADLSGTLGFILGGMGSLNGCFLIGDTNYWMLASVSVGFGGVFPTEIPKGAGGSASLTGGRIFSNARSGLDLADYGFCVGVGAGSGLYGEAQVCWSVDKPVKGGLLQVHTSGYFTVYLGAGMGVGVSIGGVGSYTKVRDLGPRRTLLGLDLACGLLNAGTPVQVPCPPLPTSTIEIAPGPFHSGTEPTGGWD